MSSSKSSGSSKPSKSNKSNKSNKPSKPVFPEYDDSYSSSEHYFNVVDKYINHVKQNKYNMILKFVNRWMKGILKLWKLTDFTGVSQFSLPKDKHSRYVLENYADDICKELGVDYEFNKKNIEEHYKKLGKCRKKSSEISNAAHDDKYIYRSEMINVVRAMLKKIDYVLYSKRTDKCIIWWIAKCEPLNTSLNIHSFIDVQDDQDESMADYINKRYKNGRRIRSYSENQSTDSNDSDDSGESDNSDDSNNSDESNNSDDSNNSDESNNSDDSDNSGESNNSNNSEESDDSEESE
jgi:hypothetical protein